ncbi:MAG TPA: SDR family oxidoreductase [Anaeromyxobacter sp.]|nr:SDR family oxidoreductase [Anaeromyxobacter sp.]
MTAERKTLQTYFSLEGKVALLTGAAGGIGRVLARELAGAGAAVALHDLAPEPLQEVAAEIHRAGGKAACLTADLRVKDQAHGLAQRAREALGRLDILINCAATNRRKPIREVTEDDWDTVMAVDLKAVYFLSQAAQAVMREQGGGGKIVHIASINPFFALGSVSVYGAAKGAVVQLTKVMAVEWAKDGIQVNSIVPGFVATPLSKPLWDQPFKAEWMRNRIALRRPARPDELVAPVLLLAGPGSSYVTGTTIVVDGGVLAGGWWEPDDVLAKL